PGPHRAAARSACPGPGRAARGGCSPRGPRLVSEHGTLRLKSPAEGEGLEFEARFATGSLVIDSDAHPAGPNPVQTLLAALAACAAMDVISIRRKKRQRVSAYEVVMPGERAPEHPRYYTAIELVPRLRGSAIAPAAVEEAIRLSVEKYCSVYH